MKPTDVPIGSHWKRPDGVIVRVDGEMDNGSLREVLLIPVFVSDGTCVRQSWKWDKLVAFDFERVEEPT